MDERESVKRYGRERKYRKRMIKRDLPRKMDERKS